MAIASLQLLASARYVSAPRFNFLAVALPQSGMILDQPVTNEEDLVSPGINFQRWREIFRQYPETVAETIIDCTDFNAARILARLHNAAARRLADLVITYGTSTDTYRKVKIIAAAARPLQGSVTGSGTTGSPTASVRTSWVWKVTEGLQ